jgi:alcohol dehydrogenase class IV
MRDTTGSVTTAWGAASRDRLPGELSRLGAGKPMPLHAPERTGSALLAEVRTGTRLVATFGDVVADPTIEFVLAAVEQAPPHGVDRLVDSEGGSVVVTSRAVGSKAWSDELRSPATHRDDGSRIGSPHLGTPAQQKGASA